MPTGGSVCLREAVSYCGLWRERGTVRTSSSRVTPCSSSSAISSAMGRVEWPMVQNTARPSLHQEMHQVDADGEPGAVGERRHEPRCVPLEGTRLAGVVPGHA